LGGILILLRKSTRARQPQEGSEGPRVGGYSGMRTAIFPIPVCAFIWLVDCPSSGPVKEERRDDTPRLTLSQLSWAFEIRATGFTVQKEEARPDGSGVMLQ